MDWPTSLLCTAGLLGVMVAFAHGIIMQRAIVRPLRTGIEGHGVLHGVSRRLVAPLLHVSTLDWFVVGVALLFAAASGETNLRLGVCLVAIPIYLAAAVVNLFATKGRHIGWVAMALAGVLTSAAAWQLLHAARGTDRAVAVVHHAPTSAEK